MQRPWRGCAGALGSEEEAGRALRGVLRAREAIASYDPRRPFQLVARDRFAPLHRALRRRALEGRLFEPADLAEDTLPESGPAPLGSVSPSAATSCWPR
jgi:hypothetical protein